MKISTLKKTIAVFFTAVFCLCLTSCSQMAGNARPSDLVYSVISDCEGFEGAYTVYFANGTEGENGYISEEDFYSLYFSGNELNVQPANELSLLSDWCIAISSSPEVKEIHILKAKSRSECERIVEMLERRAKLLSSPELYQSESKFLGNRPKDVRVFTSGNFAVLAVCENASAIEKFLK